VRGIALKVTFADDLARFRHGGQIGENVGRKISLEILTAGTFKAIPS